MTDEGPIRWGQLMLGMGASLLVISVYFWVVLLYVGLALDAPDWVAIPLALLLLIATVTAVILLYRRDSRSLAIGVAAGYVLLSFVSLGQCTLIVAFVPT